ncbi:lytic transglycosylase domain-containing protein [Rhodomicrobium vannielii ATCC 17100]|uniref:transglycosylase SLT domain-containing protein n=1 Tax=Rhodomicrobium vannielii TaxID=1069 RepID=UPI00191B1514|nr:lytic transglycosylase domain-containing protein [Rhodomicrobium vannielii ATCC 17100]
MGKLRAIAIAVLFIFSLPPAGAVEQNLCEREMVAAASKYEIPLGVLYAVGLAETGIGGNLRAFSLNLEGKAIYSLDKAQAIERFHAARRDGLRLIDVGCMQLNYYFHGEQFASVDEMLDPRKNVDYAARFLKELKQREGTWTLAVARYNAGKNNKEGQKRYICQVLDRLVQSGFGVWTPRASEFCASERRQAATQPK